MAENSKIEWTDHTFNPWWGCVKVSEACRNCYAATFDKRVGGANWGVNAPRRFFGDKHWNEPLKWNRDAEETGVRRKVFCASMADVFEMLPADHPDARRMDEARDQLWKLISDTPHLDWLLLTKRPENIGDMIPWSDGQRNNSWKADVSMWQNVWLGTTIEEEKHLRRVLDLLKVPVAIRFVSMEPLLDAVNLRQVKYNAYNWNVLNGSAFNTITGEITNTATIHWVITGGESGHGARPSHPDWFRSLRDQCVATGVPFLFKQWGDMRPTMRGMDTQSYFTLFHGVEYERVGKKKAGRLLDGRTWDEFPEVRVLDEEAK